MSFLSRIRQYNTVRVYNDMRRSLAVLSVGFIVGGIMGLLGFGETRSSGQLVEGTERLIALLLFIVLGALLGLLRLTVFRNRRAWAEGATALGGHSSDS